MRVTSVRDHVPSAARLPAVMVRRSMNADSSAVLAAAVTEELRWDPLVEVERINVSAEDSRITLQGVVRTYAQKCRAEKIAREIRGVVEVRNELDVRLAIGSYRTDDGLERLAASIMQNHSALCDPLPRVTAHDGWLTLSGVVTAEAQKRATEDALRDLAGIRGIVNCIEVAPRTEDAGDTGVFLAAVLRRGNLSVKELKVEVNGGAIAIDAKVASCAEHDALIELASCRRGIVSVEDRVVVQPTPATPNPRTS
jgi:osmotically-inducible protein OsmY